MARASPTGPIEVFISYSHEDDGLREKLGKHLSLLGRQGVIDAWHDRRIGAGTEWAGAIDDHLNRAAVVLLLVSSDFLDSDYCYDLEMKRALERHDAGDAWVVPVILRPVDWQGAPFAKLQALPKDGRPVTSWPNEDEAFTAIALGIREVVEQLRPVAGGQPPDQDQRLPAIWNVPYLKNPHFTGRDELLGALHAKLTQGRVALTAVHGMGGVGKTQLALEYAWLHAGDLDLVWWLRAEEPATLLEDFAALAGPLGLAQAKERELAAVADAVREALTRREGWLLVFDNAGEPGEFEDLLPRGTGGRVLITSRNPAWPYAAPLDVPTLARDAAIEFLRERTGQGDGTAVGDLADALGDLPLALEQAAAYMVETGTTFSAYLDLFRTRRTELWGREKPPAGHPETVGTTWTLAVERLRTDQPRGADLLSLCAFLAPEAIPRNLLTAHPEALPPDLAAAVVDPLRLNALVGALRRYSLVETTGEGLSFHRLVQAATRDALEPDDRRRWLEAAVALMRAGFPYDRDDPKTWAPAGGLLTHTLAAAGHAEAAAKDLEGTRWLLDQTARYFVTRAELERARAGFALALDLAEAALGADAKEVAIYVNNLGLVLQSQGDLPEAKAAYERALKIDEASFGPDHPNVAIRVNNLGSVLKAQGDLAGGKAAFERALGIDEASFGPDHPNVATDVNNLGSVLQDLGDLAGAKAAFERALKIDEASFGADHPNVARDVNNLGMVLKDLGDLAGAKAAYERALGIDEASFGPEHPNVAIRVWHLGTVVEAEGDASGAKAMYERASATFERFLGADHVNTRGVRGFLKRLEHGAAAEKKLRIN